jgi:endonuclease/exonuclease/phosphatase family metal-dependent hydrolase
MEENNQPLVDALARYRNMKQLRRSPAFLEHHDVLRDLFNRPRTYLDKSATPRLRSFLRVAAWNIECGKSFDGIVHSLNTDPVLRLADLILLSEVDAGMARSGNRSVAAELGRAIGAHAIYGIEYLELHRQGGGGDPANTAALHGNAILTRHPFSSPRLIRLPRCERNFESAQKRLGGRLGLVIEVVMDTGLDTGMDTDSGTVNLLAATTHLDVVNAPRCRQKQMRSLLDYLEPGSKGPAILGGDLNTHTFSRGTRIQALGNLARLLLNPEAVTRSLLRPHQFEPVLQDLELFEFNLQGFNDELHTCRVDDSQLLQSSDLPGPLKELVRRRFGARARSLDFRLDWLAGRQVRPLKQGEMVDAGSGARSISPTTITRLEYKGLPVSDHSPIVADIAVTAGNRPRIGASPSAYSNDRLEVSATSW